MFEFDNVTKEGRALFYSSTDWRDKRQEILERDNFECQMCKEEGNVTAKRNDCGEEIILEVDHIQELAEHPALALEDSNLRTLCKDCHNKRHKRMNYKHRDTKINKWQDERWE